MNKCSCYILYVCKGIGLWKVGARSFCSARSMFKPHCVPPTRTRTQPPYISLFYLRLCALLPLKRSSNVGFTNDPFHPPLTEYSHTRLWWIAFSRTERWKRGWGRDEKEGWWQPVCAWSIVWCYRGGQPNRKDECGASISVTLSNQIGEKHESSRVGSRVDNLVCVLERVIKTSYCMLSVISTLDLLF